MPVEVIADDVILIELPEAVVIDEAYLDPATYVITVVEGSGGLTVRSVLPPLDTQIATDVVLTIDKHAHGIQYRINIDDPKLSGTDGGVVTFEEDFIGRHTKVEGMIKSLPKHYNVKPDSLIRAVLTAVGRMDEEIGGSRNDTL